MYEEFTKQFLAFWIFDSYFSRDETRIYHQSYTMSTCILSGQILNIRSIYLAY